MNSLLLLSQLTPPLADFTNLGVAGVMGMMWLWERRTSRQREQQIDEAHARIMADRVMLDQLIDVVQKNSEALTELSTIQQQIIEQLRTRSAA